MSRLVPPQTVTATLRLHRGQSRVMKSRARFVVWDAGRRTGKTEVGVVFLIQEAQKLIARGVDPGSLELWWVAPTWELARRGFNKVKKRSRADGTRNPLHSYFLSSTESPGNLKILCKGGFVIKFLSAENEDQLRGEGVHAAIVDEAGMMRETAWTECLYPALTDAKGRALLISTPKGRNWFYKLWLRGQDPADRAEIESFRSPSWENPHLHRDVIAAAKRDLPDRVYRQEYEAEFLEDSGGVFRRVRSLVTSAKDYRGPATARGWNLQEPTKGVKYVAGWDPAKHQDFSVLTILRLPERHVVHWRREQLVDYDAQCRLVADACQRYNGARLLMDSTGVGDPLFDFMKRFSGLDVEGYKFTSTTKADLVNELALAVDNGTVSFPDLPVLVNEMEVFEATRNESSGNVKYSAPEGLHDDAVMSLALAVRRSMTQDVAFGSVSRR